MRALRILAMVLGGLLTLVVTLVAALFVFLQTSSGQRTLAGLVSGKSLQVSGISGFFPTDLQVARIELLDQQGPWLRVDNARLRWSFASLLGGRVRVEIISAALVDVLRAPVPDKAEPATAAVRSAFRSASRCSRCRSTRCILRRRSPRSIRAGR